MASRLRSLRRSEAAEARVVLGENEILGELSKDSLARSSARRDIQRFRLRSFADLSDTPTGDRLRGFESAD